MAELRDFDATNGLTTGSPADGRWPEGMSYSNVNNAARENQAILARDFKNRNGSLIATGDADNLSVTPHIKSGDTYDMAEDGDRFSFRTPVALNAGAMLMVGTVAAAPLRDSKGEALEANATGAGMILDCVFRNAAWNIQNVINPSGLNVAPEDIAGVDASPAVVSVKNARTADTSPQKSLWQGSVAEHTSETKGDDVIYVERSQDLIRPVDSVNGIEGGNVRGIVERRANVQLEVEFLTKAQFDAITTYVANRLYLYPRT